MTLGLRIIERPKLNSYDIYLDREVIGEINKVGKRLVWWCYAPRSKTRIEGACEEVASLIATLTGLYGEKPKRVGRMRVHTISTPMGGKKR